MKKVRKKNPAIKEAGFIIREVRPGYYFIDSRRKGMTVRKGFGDLEEAKQYCRLKAAEIKRKGTDAAGISDRLRLDAVEAAKLLGKVSILEAARFYLRHHRPGSDTRTVNQLVAEHLTWLHQTKSRRPQTIRERKYRLHAFARRFGDTPIQLVSRADIETWLEENDWQPLNRRHYIAAVHAMFGYARQKELMDFNPAENIEKPVYTPRQPEIISPRNVRILLQCASQQEPELVAPLALSFFCGLRPQEIMRLDWRDISLEEGFIRVGAAIAKMRMQRNVDLAPNAVKWLAPHRKRTGLACTLPYPTFRAWVSRIAREAEIKVPYNAGRHAFASYHFALHAPEDTAKQLGHARTDLLVTTYRGVVSKHDARDFWAIMPTHEDNIIRLNSRHG